MRLFFDEDMGRGIPEALRSVGLGEPPDSITYVKKVWGARSVVADEQWIPWAAENGYVAFSCNRAIIDTEAQRELVRSSGLGIIFLTSGQERSVAVLRRILSRWAWLETIERSEQRPFAYLFPMAGTPRRDPRF